MLCTCQQARTLKDACAHFSVLLSMGLSPLEKWPPPLLLLLLRFLPASLPVPLPDALSVPLPLPLPLPLLLALDTCSSCLCAACRCGCIRSATGSLLAPS